MRIAGQSKLDAHAALLCELWRQGETVAEIRRRLKRAGCQATNTTIGTWLLRRVDCNELEPRVKPPSKTQKSLSDEPKSLGLLDGPDDSEAAVRARTLLRIVFEPELASDADAVRRILRRCHLLNELGELDFAGFAKRIGVRSHSFGDMDYIVLAMWTPEFRNLLSTPREHSPSDLRTRLVALAQIVRAQMSAALD